MESKAFHKIFLNLKDKLMDKRPDNGFMDTNGVFVKPGDRVYYSLRNVEGILLEALQDGDATIELDDGKMLFVKWCRLLKK